MTIIFTFPQYKVLATNLAKKTGFELGDLEMRSFPDLETYVKINSDVKNKKVILFCGLENPNSKIMALMFFAKTAKELGAKEVGLIAPYLGYMRMDKRFNDGEAITSNIFAEFLSQQIDYLITIDPHLHRHKTLEEIYKIPCKTLHANKIIANWIKNNVKNALLIGPDEESKQWLEEISTISNSDFVILNKIRHGDRNVTISIPQIEQYKNHIPILIDDIISTAQTMIAAVNHLQIMEMPKPICIGIHAIFADNAFEELAKHGPQKIITCNTILHSSNDIDITDLIVSAIL